MKTLLLTVFILISCNQPREFDVPKSLGNEENQRLQSLLQSIDEDQKTIVGVGYLKSLFVRGEVVEITANLVVKAYVASSDEAGNFFKEIYVQDHPSEPTAGMKVVIDRRELHNKYNLGRELYIDLKGLYVGETRKWDGVIALGGGENKDQELEPISEKKATETLLRSSNALITPSTFKLSELSDNHIGMFVRVEQVNFMIDDHGAPLVDPFESYDSQHIIESCEGLQKTEFLLETSSFADFAQMPIPTKGGAIQGIITKTFNGSDLVLVINQYQDLMLDQEPCSP
jgi:hypothetical protein